MKKYIWTYWTDPEPTRSVWNLMCYAVSIEMAKKLSNNLLVYTDKMGALLFKKYKIDVPLKIIDFDIKSPKFPKFSEAKLKTLSLQEEPFCHIDHDVFLFKEQKTFKDSDITVQSIDTGEMYYDLYFTAFNSRSNKEINFPEEIRRCALADDYAGYNCGYIEGLNIDVVQEWCKIGLKLSKEYIPIKKVDNVVPEQFCLYALAKYRNYKISTLFKDPCYYQDEPIKAGYVHLMGSKANNYNYVTKKLIKRAQEFAPNFYSSLSFEEIDQLNSETKPPLKPRVAGAATLGRLFFLINTQKGSSLKNIYKDDKQIGRLFRCGGGFNILDAFNVLFADIDFSYSDYDVNLTSEAKTLLQEKSLIRILPKIKEVADEYGLVFRSYLTAHGLRLICVNKPFNPESKLTESVLNALKVDPTYGYFLTQNFSFPARVQPKPHRMNYPIVDYLSFYTLNDQQKKIWLLEYDERMREYSVCRYMFDIVGDGAVNETFPECQKIVSIHDKLTRCFSDLPLA